MLDQLFSAHIGPVPVWLILAVGGVAVAIFAPKLLARFGIGGSSGSAPAASTSPAAATPAPDASIDPVTGIPYTVENSTNPNTGLPLYTNYVPAVSQSGIQTPASAPGSSSAPASTPAASGNYITVGTSPGGNTLNSIAQYYGYSLTNAGGQNLIYGNPQNYSGGNSTIQPYSYGFNYAIPAGTKIYLPAKPSGSGVGPGVHDRWPFYRALPRAS